MASCNFEEEIIITATLRRLSPGQHSFSPPTFFKFFVQLVYICRARVLFYVGRCQRFGFADRCIKFRVFNLMWWLLGLPFLPFGKSGQEATT